MLQVFYLDVSIDLGEAHVAAASAPSWVTARACWCVHAGARNVVGSGGPYACVGPHGLQRRMVRVRELHALGAGAGAGASSDASVLDRTFGR
jgi:hypothetical protein